MTSINHLVVELAKKKEAGIDISDLNSLKSLSNEPVILNYLSGYTPENWLQELPFWESMVDRILAPEAVVA